ncbi:MAG TPA: hypothetical protein VJ695_01295 [Nitrososphaera sp.]|nr:hypothetical protein [Nitrososphaera sp.]
MQDIAIGGVKRAASLSRMVTATTALMFLVLVAASPSLFSQPQRAEASVYGIEHRVPPAYMIIDGKAPKLQPENNPISGEDSTADYDVDPLGTITFGERVQVLVPQVRGIFKDVQSIRLMVCSDEACMNNGFHIRKGPLDIRDTRFLYLETDVIGAPIALRDGFTASEDGFKVFLFWTVSFTDGTDQTYLAVVNLEGDPCEEHGWDYHPDTDTRCVDFGL